MRERLAELLDRQPGLQVVARVPSAAGGLFQAQQARPQVTLVNAALGPDDSRQCVRRTKDLLPEARVVVMNAAPTGDEIVAFIQEGADGLIHEHATLDEFVAAIRTVAEGQNVLPDPLTPLLFAHLADQPDVVVPLRGSETGASLTQREREVAGLIAEGYSNKAIAAQLGVALHTVKSHVHRALEKLEVSSRLQLAARARAAGWVVRPG